MNGRLYDPETARFLQPDPLVANAHDSQSYNRYSYVLNNPLAYTDPTGYRYEPSGWDQFIDNTIMPMMTAVAAIGVCGPGAPLCMMAFNIGGAALNVLAQGGGESHAIGAMINAGASALLFTAAGDIANSLAQVNLVGPLPANEQALRTAFGSSGFAIGRATLHALAGCIGNAVAGQSCGSGAAGAFVGKLAQLSFADSSFANSEFGRMPEGGFIIAATAGCAGGFAGGGGAMGCGGGAAMAAAGYLFNAIQQDQQAGTTRVEIQGNLAATFTNCSNGNCMYSGVGPSYDRNVWAIHLSLTIYDSYSGITTLDGQPRLCSGSVVCLNSLPIDGMKPARIVWGPIRLKPPDGMGENSFGVALRRNSAQWQNGQTPYRLDSTSNTFVQKMLTTTYGAMQRFDFRPYQAPGYEGKK